MSGNNLGVAAVGRENNLNFMRFVAALLVVLCHAYPLGENGLDILGRVTKGQMHFGFLAVSFFFFFAGFLISRSVERAKSGWAFFRARCLRIFPCLFVVTVLSAFVLGPLLTENELGEYFANAQTWKYLLNSVFLLVHDLPGVFVHNIYGQTVNGSLWTLPLEFLCYVACFCFYRIGFLKERRFWILLPLFVVGYVAMAWVVPDGSLLLSARMPCGMFFAGMLCHTYRKQIRLHMIGALLCLIGLVVSSLFQFLAYGALLFLPYLYLYLAFGTRRIASGFGVKHEISYGMYLCAFPLQQMLVQCFGGQMDPILNFLLAAPLTMLGGWLLCSFVEKPLERFRANHGETCETDRK